MIHDEVQASRALIRKAAPRPLVVPALPILWTYWEALIMTAATSYSHSIRALTSLEIEEAIPRLDGICALSCGERIAYEISYWFQRSSTGREIQVRRWYCEGHGSLWACRHGLTEARLQAVRRKVAAE